MSAKTLRSLKEIPLAEAAEIMSAERRESENWADRRFGQVGTDTRTLGEGDYFLALRGEHFDGHQFVSAAFEKGAAGAIVDREFHADNLPADRPIVRVDDTLAAYGRLAAQRRKEWGGPVLALSGSAGKTTTRRMIATALASRQKVLEPIKNFNNLIGVPQTLLRLEADHEAAVLELGMNQPGELRQLTEIAQPDAALLTGISMAHIGMFRSMDALTEAKLDLFKGCNEGVPLVVNARCDNTMRNLGRFRAAHPIVAFTTDRPPLWDQPVDVRIENVTPLEPVGYRFDLIVRGDRYPNLELRLFGRHHLANVAAAAALMLAGGFDPAWLAETIGDVKTEPLRGDWIPLGEGEQRIDLILDCYNASPAGMESALDSLAEAPRERRLVLVLADMLELGGLADAAHANLKERIGQVQPDIFFALGPHCSRLAGFFQGVMEGTGRQARGFASRDDLIAALKQAVRPGDILFFKGSHSYGLEHAAQAVAPELNIIETGSV